MSSSCNEIMLFPASVKTTAGVKWGYINEGGEFVITPHYDKANDFQTNGLAIVEVNNRAGVIDTTGSYVVMPLYQFIEPFSEGLAVASEKRGKMRVIDENGRVRTKAFSFIRSYQENRAAFLVRNGENRSFSGYLDRECRIVIQPHYISAHDFTFGKALVQLGDKTHALIGLNGEILQTYPFQRMGEISEGLLSFVKNDQGLTGYVNEAGMVVISPVFTGGSKFNNGRAVVGVRKNDRHQSGLIDMTGAFIIPPEYDEIIMLGEKRAAVGKAHDPNNIWQGIVYAIADTESGRIFTDFIYDQVYRFQGEFSSVTKGRYSFFIKKNGVPAASLPLIHGKGELTLKGNVIKAEVDGRYSYYDRQGHLIYHGCSLL